MNESSSVNVRYFTPSQIGVAAFLGAPIAACWFISRNYAFLGNAKLQKKYFIGGIIATIIVLGLSFILPANFPASAVPISYTVAIYQMSKQLDPEVMKQVSSNSNAVKGSWGRVLGISLLYFIVVFALIIAASFLMPAPPPPTA